MVYHIRYNIHLKIAKKNRKEALRIFNYLHTDEMLEKYAHGGSYYGGELGRKPIRERKWYSWVKNPDEPYKTLKEAFENWGIVDRSYFRGENKDDCDFEIEGEYNNKLLQQDFLIEILAPVLKNTVIYVFGEHNECFAWIINKGEFTCKTLTIYVEDDEDTETDEEKEEKE